MNCEQVVSLTQAHQAELEALGVQSLDLFGSVARNQAGPESDVDFLVEFATEASLFDLFRVRHYLEDLLHCNIDLGTRDALKAHLRESISQDTIRVF